MAIKRNKKQENTAYGSQYSGSASRNGAIYKENRQNHDFPVVKEYRQLGKTGFMASDISCGTPPSEAVLKALLELGVNFIDTGETYDNGNNERLIGRVIKDYDRKKIFINSKLYTDDHFLSKEDCIDRTRKALERLGTDYVDCMMIHSAENSRIIKDEHFHAAMEMMKQEGRVKHVGVSCHGNNWLINPEESLEKIMMTAVEDGRFDVVMLGYNFMNADMAEKILDACAEKGIGTSIIKSNPVKLYLILDERIKRQKEAGTEPGESTLGFWEKYKGMTEKARIIFEKYGLATDEDLAKAATRFVLSNPKAHTICWGFASLDDIRDMLSLSGQKLNEKDVALLRNYHDIYGHLNCRIGCNACENACPHHLPVGTIMRYRYYFEVKGQVQHAREQYARLKGPGPEVCADCAGYCEQVCPYGVSARALLASAHRQMAPMVS
ncbi:MAG TPA: hypothetical protein ENN63_03910 [Bacteroidetes bacterium]|nr:hypothetical protein [Bacteroidota bacterium]